MSEPSTAVIGEVHLIGRHPKAMSVAHLRSLGHPETPATGDLEGHRSIDLGAMSSLDHLIHQPGCGDAGGAGGD
jgi:hypothetical protein